MMKSLLEDQTTDQYHEKNIFKIPFGPTWFGEKMKSSRRDFLMDLII